MGLETQKADIEKMIEGVEDDMLKEHLSKGMKYLDDPSRNLFVAFAIVRARTGGYEELALKLAQLAQEKYPEDSHFLIELSHCLDRPEDIVNLNETFLKRVALDSLAEDQMAKIEVTLALGYKEIEKVREGVKILEASKGEIAQRYELLAELYFLDNQPQKAIDLLFERLKDRGKLSEGMVHWMGESFDVTGNYSKAVEMLEKFKDDSSIMPLFEEVKGKVITHK